MKLLLAIKSLAATMGGAERVFVNIANALHGRGYELTVLTYDPPSTAIHFSLHSDIRTIALGLGHTGRPATIAETVRRMIAVRRVVGAVEPDLIIAFMHSMYIPLGLSLLTRGIPIIASEHTVWEHYRTRWAERVLMSAMPYFLQAVVVTSKNAKAGFPPGIRRIMKVVANPLSVEVGCKADVTGAAEQRKIVLSVGRLSMEKDHLTLIEAFARVAVDFPDWNLRIVGEGTQRAPIEDRISSLKLESRVELAGITLHIEKEYLRAQFFVMPSRYESFGLASAEALSLGLPVVGFADCPGTNELIKHDENGLLVCGTDRVSGLAFALRRLMGAPELRLRLGNAGPESVVQFSPEKIIGKWEQLLCQYVPSA